MRDAVHNLSEAVIRRRILWREIVVFGISVALITTVNVFTELTNYARSGALLSPWEPVVWEYSSGVVICVLIPCIAWFNRYVLITAHSWKWALPAHLLVTIPFSVIHVSGMVGLRTLAYHIAGRQYDFGPPLATWVYEYRKDFISYWMIVGALYAFRTYRLWLESRAAPAAPPEPVPSAGGGLERLIVKKLNREFILNTVEIDRIESSGNYVTVYAQGASYLLRESLVSLEKKLDPKRFARVHRGHIVNLDQVREIQPWDSGDYRILLKDGSFVNFSRRYRSRLPQLFNS